MLESRKVAEMRLKPGQKGDTPCNRVWEERSCSKTGNSVFEQDLTRSEEDFAQCKDDPCDN